MPMSIFQDTSRLHPPPLPVGFYFVLGPLNIHHSTLFSNTLNVACDLPLTRETSLAAIRSSRMCVIKDMGFIMFRKIYYKTDNTKSLHFLIKTRTERCNILVQISLTTLGNAYYMPQSHTLLFSFYVVKYIQY
jgi:hypothetical protein